MRKTAATAIAAAALSTAAAAAENIVFFQGFEDNTRGVIETNLVNQGNVSSNDVVDPTTGLMTGPGLEFDGSGPAWSLFWSDSRGFGIDGPIETTPGFPADFADLDLIGVTNSTGAGTPFPEGSQGFAAFDMVGEIRLSFEPLDIAVLDSPNMRFDIRATDDFDAGDRFAVEVNGDTLFERSGAAIGSLAGEDGGFLTRLIDLSLFEGAGPIQIDVVIDSAAGEQGILLDNIAIGENLIPSPGAGTLLVLAALACYRRLR